MKPILRSIPLAACAGSLLLSACFYDAPKYKPGNGEFPEWETYESKHFSPANATITAVDLKANTITFATGKYTKTFPVLPSTRIIHEGTDIPLSQLPVNQPVKIVFSQDGSSIISVWFGVHLYQAPTVAAGKVKK
jgi:hypothetical protein